MLNKHRKFKYFLPIFLLVITSFVVTDKVSAANLSLSPSSAMVSVGNIISLKVNTNTDNKFINNAEATIQFPADLLEVVSITKSSSVFTLWVEEPSFSNSVGKITFNGGVPTPGFNGSNGYITTITFKAKKQGTASVIFTDGAIRENDGLGTDIMTSKNGSVIQIGLPKEIEIPTTPNEKSAIPAKPIIISETHPDQDFWYKNNTATFSWKIPSGVTSLKTLFSKTADGVPTITYDNSVTQKTLNNLSDGISYFHLRYYNSAGASLITHYRVRIDVTPPLAFNPTLRNENGNNLIKLNALDVTSGIDYYNLQIDNQTPIKVNKEDLINNEYILPIQNEGDHQIIVTVYDKAGNKTESTTSFKSLPITVPLISLSSKEITSGESVVVLGKTDYPNKQVNIILEKEGKEIGRYIQTTSSDGTFSVSTDKLKTIGSIGIWAETIFSDTIKSGQSQKIYLKVNETTAVKITLAIFYPLVGIILILILLLIILILLYLGWHKYFGLKKKIEKQSKELTTEVHKAMLLLKDELNGQLKSLEKVKIERNLNEKEEIIFGQIEKNVNDIDTFIEEKLNKIK